MYLITGILPRGGVLAQLAAIDAAAAGAATEAGAGAAGAGAAGAAGAGAAGAGAGAAGAGAGAAGAAGAGAGAGAGAAEVASLSEEGPSSRKRALLGLVRQMLQQEPARRPTVAQLLNSLSEVQRQH